MLPKEQFTKIKKELEKFEEQREKTIQVSREVIKLSKLIIYALHRNDIKDAEKHVKTINIKIKLLNETQSYDTNIAVTAFQEYVEALTYYWFVTKRKLPSHQDLKVSIESYLLGLCDLTGELVRKAINEGIKNNVKATEEIKNLIADIYHEFLQLDLRNGELRKKFDSIKYNLQKLEDIMFTMKVQGRWKE